MPRLDKTDDENDGIESTSGWFPTLHSRAEWLFQFMRMDLGALSPDDLSDVQRRAADFAGGAVEANDDLDSSKLPRIWPTHEALRRTQLAAHDGWRRLLAKEWWILDGPIKLGIRGGRRVIRGYREGPFRDLFLAAAQDAVQQSWDRLHTCQREGCGNVFVKTWRQVFCSPSCSQRDRMERFRANHPFRDYRAERERAHRKRYGNNVKLGLRPTRGRRPKESRGDK